MRTEIQRLPLEALNRIGEVRTTPQATEGRDTITPTFETEVLDEMVKDICFADGPGSHCECPKCEKAERESMADALRSYGFEAPNHGEPTANGICEECGESYDEGNDTTCDWCLHEECRDGDHLCEDCQGTAIDRAMDACDMER